MTGVRSLTRLVATSVAAAAALSVGLALAQDTEGSSQATLEIHKSECYHGVGPDIFEECHENVLADVGFTVNGAEGTTDADGHVSFHGPAATITISEDPDTYGNYLGAYVYCAEQNSGIVLFDGSATDTGGVVTITVEDGDDVVCDWYDITEAPAEDGTDGGTGGTTTLPATGSGPARSPRTELALLVGTLSLMALAWVAREPPAGFIDRRGRTCLPTDTSPP